MAMLDVQMSDLDALVGSELDSVEFVRDYYQLNFGSATLSVLSRGTLKLNNSSISDQGPGFADAIIARIGDRISGVHENESELRLVFAGGAEFDISLLPEHRVILEAAILDLGERSRQGMTIW